MPDYYNRGNRTPKGGSRQQNGGRYTGDSQRYPEFEEGYTSADSRSRQNSRQSNRTAQDDFGYDSRFIDAGDRYMRSAGNEYPAQQQSGRYQTQGYDDYSESRGYSGGFEDDFDDMPQQRGYAQQEDAYTDSRYSQRVPQQTRPGGYRQEEYYDRAPAQSSRRTADREYYGQEDRYTQQRRAAANDHYQRYEQDYSQGYDDDLAEDNRRAGAERRTSRQQEYYRAPVRQTAPAGSAKRGTNDVLGGIIDWFNGLSSRQMTWILAGAAVVLVAIILIVCLVMQADSCTGCAGGSDIPVVEQGDGEESLNDGQSFYEGSDYVPDDTTEVVSTSDGMITIDEDIETDSFTVEVTGADGTYSRTDVRRAEAASLVVSEQNETGFSFSLEVKGEGVSGSLSGYAYFCGEREAVYEGAEGLLNFSFGSSGITVYQVDVIEAFTGISPDGIYVEGAPSYVEDEAEKAEQRGLDADIRSTEAVQQAISELLSEDDAALMALIFTNGTEVIYEGAEKGYDKNGTEINIDAQLEAVKYYAFIDGTGEELVMICTADAKVYIGISDGVDYRYYTNDPDYAETAPKSISGQAKGRGMELEYQQ